ncbi:MAG: hypothetical protein Q9166_002385 [cf. Caloplaca sp. 2 TL-2023]
MWRATRREKANYPGFPELLKFEGGGRKSCEFSRSEDDSPGDLFCEGIKADCNKVDKVNEVRCSGGQTWHWNKQLTCIFPPPAPPPPPPPPSLIYAVGYFQTCVEGGDCQNEAAVFVPAEDDHYACLDKPLYRDTNWVSPDRPALPQTIKFEGGGRKDCEYKRSDDDDTGYIRCGPDRAVECKKEKIVERKCDDYDLKGESWRTQVTCKFAPPKKARDLLPADRVGRHVEKPEIWER